MPRQNPYQHYCSIARALDRIGDRWTLLIVRDLLRGPLRFGDLQTLLARITPRQLTLRLKELEADGLVVRRTEVGQKRVTYELTDTGRSLRPVVHALAHWGTVHAMGPPRPNEVVHPQHLFHGATVMLHRLGIRPEQPVRWVFHVSGYRSAALDWDGRRWIVSSELRDATLQITAEANALAQWVYEPQRMASLLDSFQIEGDASHLQQLLVALAEASPGPDDEQVAPLRPL